MKINIKVITKAKRNEIKKVGDNYKAWLTIAPTQGKANQALIELLANYFKIKKSQIKIIKGARSKNKVIEI